MASFLYLRIIGLLLTVAHGYAAIMLLAKVNNDTLNSRFWGDALTLYNDTKSTNYTKFT